MHDYFKEMHFRTLEKNCSIQSCPEVFFDIFQNN